MKDAATGPVPPRLSATLLLLRDDPFEVLLVRRPQRAEDVFSAALVFPGGGVDPDDGDDGWQDHVDGWDRLDTLERSLRIAACRETFEEVGILLAHDRAGAQVMPGAAMNSGSFRTTIGAMKTRLQLSELVPFGHWVTPEGMRRRFDTHFFLARVPDGAEPVCDGHETLGAEWDTPGNWLARVEANEAQIVFPTRVNLKRLAESDDVEGALAAARLRPVVTVLPYPEMRDGRIVITVPTSAGYDVPEHWLDRD